MTQLQQAQQLFLKKTIVDVRLLHQTVLAPKLEHWDSNQIVLILDDGSHIIPVSGKDWTNPSGFLVIDGFTYDEIDLISLPQR